jgi:hypothetical protein
MRSTSKLAFVAAPIQPADGGEAAKAPGLTHSGRSSHRAAKPQGMRQPSTLELNRERSF